MSVRKMLTLENLLAHFPRRHRNIRPNQQAALEFIAETGGSVLIEAPTGSGKTDIGITVLDAAGSGFYVVPNKAQLDQLLQQHPHITTVYGRNEYDCLYYDPDIYKADEIPCLSLDCPHRVDQTTGKTVEKGATPCPYYLAKYRAKQAPIVASTMAFYLFTHLFSREFDTPKVLVIDEVHEIARVVRSCLSYDITDWHLSRGVELLSKIDATDEAAGLDKFRKGMVRIIKSKPNQEQLILKPNEIERLIGLLSDIDGNALRKKLSEAIAQGKIDPREDRVTLQQLESITYDLYRYIRSFEFSLPTEHRHALNYVTYAYIDRELEGNERVRYRLIIKAYYVVPLIRKLLAPTTIAYSATIGDPGVFAFETGIKAPFCSLAGTFPVKNTLVLLPNDTPNLTARLKSKYEPTKVLRRIAKECQRLSRKHLRSLVIVVSERERQSFIRLCAEEGVSLLTYDADLTAREAAAQFKQGEGSVLVGTTAQYGAGLDLPGAVANVTFVLRPSYPSPYDPATQFEEQRFGGQRWKVWKWRAMIEALQVRGRNVRSAQDRGVTIFVSQQFRDFLYGSLPEWLQESYEGDLTLTECVDAAVELLTS